MSVAFYSPEGYFIKLGCKCDLHDAVEKTAHQHAAECWYVWHDGGHTSAYANTPAETFSWLRFMEKEAKRNDRLFVPHVWYKRFWRGTEESLTQEEWDFLTKNMSSSEVDDIYYTVDPGYGLTNAVPTLEELNSVLDPALLEEYEVTDRFWVEPQRWNPFAYSAPGASWRYEMD